MSGLRRVREPQPRLRRGGEADACGAGSAPHPRCRCTWASSAACWGHATWSMSSPTSGEPKFLAVTPRRQNRGTCDECDRPTCRARLPAGGNAPARRTDHQESDQHDGRPVAGADHTCGYDARQQGALIESLGGLARLGGIRHARGLDRLVSVRVAISRRCERVRVGAASGHSSGYRCPTKTGRGPGRRATRHRGPARRTIPRAGLGRPVGALLASRKSALSFVEVSFRVVGRTEGRRRA